MAAPTTTQPTIIDQPGVYDGMSDATYHLDPVPAGSLSSSGAKRLLPPNCPARFRHEQLHGRAPKRAFDLGHVAHQKALGVGAEIVVVDAENWQTKAAREKRDEAYAAGNVPILAREDAEADAMAAAIRQHPVAAALLNPTAGKPEQSAFWVDDRTGIWRRARFDFLRPDEVVDLKTCDSADEESIQKAIHRYRYHQQASFYLDAVRDLGLSADPAFIFIFVEKAAPYLIHVVQLDGPSLAKGDELNRRAIDVYAECSRTGRWPGYASDITTISLPPYALRTEESF